MREFFKEGDLISAEVQVIQEDGTLSLHTRSLRYGKVCTLVYVEQNSYLSSVTEEIRDTLIAWPLLLRQLGPGCFVVVPPVLVKRSKNHFHTLPCGVGVVLGEQQKGKCAMESYHASWGR